MLVFVLIGLSLILLGVVGLQFTYMFYIERMNAERRKHMQTLERRANHLNQKLEEAQKQIADQDRLIKAAYPAMTNTEEIWAEVIDEG